MRQSRVYVPSPELQTTIARGYGFRAASEDGWRGPNRKTYREARADARAHRLEADMRAAIDQASPAKGKAG